MSHSPPVERIDDPDDPRVAEFRDLRHHPADMGADPTSFIVEGGVPFGVVVRAGLRLRSILLLSSKVASLAPILGLVPDDIPIRVADRRILAEIVGFDLHRGVLACAHRPPPTHPDDLLPRCRRVVVTEALNDHENLGALFRNAAAMGVGGVLLDDLTADPLYRRSVRVSSGWAAALPHARIGSLPDGYTVLRDNGFRIVALTPAADAIPVDDAADSGMFDGRVALVVGAEGPGLSSAALAEADQRVCVPMAPGVDSINVATSLAVVGAFAASRRGWSR